MIGGKRPGNSQLPVDSNPCYCKYGNNCTVASTGILRVWTPYSFLSFVKILGREFIRGSCPIHDSDIVCLDKNKNTVIRFITINDTFSNKYLKLLVSPPFQVHAYISKLRNCNGGQGNLCTENEPCYPCELEKLAVVVLLLFIRTYMFLRT